MRSLLFAYMIVALISVPLSGAVILVNPGGTGDQPTINAAVAASAAGDTILLASGIFSGAGNREIPIAGKHLYILSESDDFNSCSLDLGGFQGINFSSTTTSASIVRGIGFTGGSAAQGGGIYASSAWLLIENCSFEMNSASGHGGGIYVYNGTYVVEDCLINDNYGRYGGGIYFQGGSLTVERCEFEGNTAETGAGLSINSASSSTVRKCLIIGNSALNFAGGIYNNSPGTYLYSCTLVENGAGSGGGGIYNHSSGWMGIDHTIIAMSTEGGSYGGTSQIYTIACCDFFGNAGGDWTTPISGYYGINGNLSVNPMFCADYTPSDPWSLDSDSPVFTASCGIMGAKDYAGCGAVGIDESSWGDIKRMHR
jgi:predicted outer membrane repeat protein